MPLPTILPLSNTIKSKKNSSSTGRIKAYKNKYNSPNINYSKYNNISKTFINCSYQNDNRPNLEKISNKKDFGRSSVNDQFLNNAHYFTDRYSTGNFHSNYTFINNQYNNLMKIFMQVLMRIEVCFKAI